MRPLGLLTAVLIVGTGVSQTPQSFAPGSFRPQAIVQVRESQVGADIVDIKVLDPNYPTDLLRSQAAAVGSNVGGGSRGVDVGRISLGTQAAQSGILEAHFAVDGLIDHRQRGVLRLQPIVRALAGAPAPNTIKQFLIDFDNAQVEPLSLGDYSSDQVSVHRDMTSPSVEYQVEILNQDPGRITIPETNLLATTHPAPEQSHTTTDWVVVLAFALGAIAAGALVYSILLVLLRPASKRGTRT